HEGAALTHDTQFGPRDIGWEVAQAAIRVDHQPVGRQHLQRLVYACNDRLGLLNGGILDVDHTQAEGQRLGGILLEELEILVALAGELQYELIDIRVENGWEQELIVAFPNWPSVAVAIADVHRARGPSDAIVDNVDGFDR